jgi:hypothetical protein
LLRFARNDEIVGASTVLPLIPAQAGIQMTSLGPRFRGDERLWVPSAEVSPSATLGYDAEARAATNGLATMNDGVGVFAQSGDQAAADILHLDVSDSALEAAAMAGIPGGAMSFPNAPTVSILVVCCSFDGP